VGEVGVLLDAVLPVGNLRRCASDAGCWLGRCRRAGTRRLLWLSLRDISESNRQVDFVILQHVPDGSCQSPHDGHASNLCSTPTLDSAVPASEQRVVTQDSCHQLPQQEAYDRAALFADVSQPVAGFTGTRTCRCEAKEVGQRPTAAKAFDPPDAGGDGQMEIGVQTGPT